MSFMVIKFTDFLGVADVQIIHLISYHADGCVVRIAVRDGSRMHWTADRLVSMIFFKSFYTHRSVRSTDDLIEAVSIAVDLGADTTLLNLL